MDKTFVKLAQYDDEISAKNAIGDQLKLIFELIGLRSDNWPSKAANIAIAQFVYLNYKNIAVQELKYAFDLAFQSRLSVKLEHFQSFSIPYLASILSAYLKYKETILEKVSEFESLQNQINEKIKRYQESDRLLKEIILSSYQEVLDDKEISYRFNMENHYEILSIIGMIDFDTETKLELLADAEEELKEQIIKYKAQIKNARRDRKDVQAITFIANQLEENFSGESYALAKSNTFKLQLKRFKSNGLKIEDLETKVNGDFGICFLDSKVRKSILELKVKLRNG